jgi:hypothetical protein
MDYAEKIGRELQRMLNDSMWSGQEPPTSFGMFRAAAMLADGNWSLENKITELKIGAAWRRTFRQFCDVEGEQAFEQAQLMFLDRLPEAVRDALHLQFREQYAGE